VRTRRTWLRVALCDGVVEKARVIVGAEKGDCAGIGMASGDRKAAGRSTRLRRNVVAMVVVLLARPRALSRPSSSASDSTSNSRWSPGPDWNF
jgi:hypothetical protein